MNPFYSVQDSGQHQYPGARTNAARLLNDLCGLAVCVGHAQFYLIGPKLSSIFMIVPGPSFPSIAVAFYPQVTAFPSYVERCARRAVCQNRGHVTELRRIPELDGVRGCAVGLVLIFHLVVGPIEAPPATFWSYMQAAGRLTWSGVDLFFVLSGFLIGGILINSRDSQITSERFTHVGSFASCRSIWLFSASLSSRKRNN